MLYEVSDKLTFLLRQEDESWVEMGREIIIGCIWNILLFSFEIFEIFFLHSQKKETVPFCNPGAGKK